MKNYIALLLTFISVCANGAIVQTVQLKNGSVLKGYVQQQDRDGNITFSSEEALIILDGDNDVVSERSYPKSELDAKWIEWAEKNDAFKNINGKEFLNLYHISFNQSNNFADTVVAGGKISRTQNFEEKLRKSHVSASKVRILEKGTKLKYLELTPNSYPFNWNDVESITAERRPKTALSGIDRCYELKSGREITGQYAGEDLNSLSLYNNDGLVETFDIDDVMRYTYKGINPNQSIFEQSELLDVVNTKDNNAFKGVIIERNFMDGKNYLVLQQSGSDTRIFKFEEIAGYSKTDNKDYNPKYDILLEKGDVRINRISTDSVGVTKIDSRLFLDSIPQKTVIESVNNDTKIFVEYSNPNRLTSDNLILVKLDKSIDRKKKKETIRYSFSTDIYDMKKIAPLSVETSVNGTTRIEYNVSGKGIFAIYDTLTREAIPFTIK